MTWISNTFEVNSQRLKYYHREQVKRNFALISFVDIIKLKKMKIVDYKTITFERD